MPIEGPIAFSRPALRHDLEVLARRITEGPGTTPPALRQAAAAGERLEGALGAYLDEVRYAPLAVTDAEVAALRAAGQSDDALFELTIAAAYGAARERLDAGLRAVAAAYGEAGDARSTD
jgi:hypothetical protein